MHHKFTSSYPFGHYCKFLIITLIVVSCGISNANAGAWPVRPGKVLLSLTGTYFNADQKWDENGRKQQYDDNGYFRSLSMYLYGEFGASRVVTIVTSIPYVSNTFTNSGLKSTVSGLGDAEIGGRIYITNIKFKFYLAVQGTIVVPLYTNTADKNLGYQAFGTDVKIIGSGSGKLSASKSFYYTVELGGRQYSSSTGPQQLRGTASFGINLDPKNQLAFSGNGVYSHSDYKQFDNNLAANKDFSYVQASISAGHTFTKDFSVFVGYNQFVAGRNTGIGSNFSLSFINKF
ncbi:hypothetical protein [Mucilaginibacter sp. KACC 22063]|uniref:hypothetical protein n=1 Tax=Mucilaginibacter sp. KACC 22063 TaxID=3025666 RepID=UPI00236668B4|nr:hypothetical protein [Mucilaginibacter sp. KACC 22063]WDF56352.1 hypothetical protein PQ461_04690 [Mucilaginibacter sp. KACC 22063]